MPYLYPSRQTLVVFDHGKKSTASSASLACKLTCCLCLLAVQELRILGVEQQMWHK
jgi:hypothetical protein